MEAQVQNKKYLLITISNWAKTGLILLGLFCSVSLYAQKEKYPQKYAQTITADELKDFVYDLASKEFAGRETGKPGQKKAAEYIVDYFKALGIPPFNGTYKQIFQLMKKEKPLNLLLTINSDTLESGNDFVTFCEFEPAKITTDSIVFAGYGFNVNAWNDYKNINVKNKVVTVLYGLPDSNKAPAINKVMQEYSPIKLTRYKILVAKKLQAKALLIIVPKSIMSTYKIIYKNAFGKVYQNSLLRQPIPYAYIDAESINELLTTTEYATWQAIAKAEKADSNAIDALPVNVKFKATKNNLPKGANILAYIEGTDPALKDETLVITAHYDHLGKKNDKIYFGADDNASGTAAIMEIAEAFVKAKENGNGPKRSILIMPVSGEEKGLLGSYYYTQHPVIPLKNTIANLNVDMIGRIDKNHKNGNYIYIIGSDRLSKELDSINRMANKQYTQLELDYRYNEPDDPNRFYYRSDHYNFAKFYIPVIFYFSGVHEDYHQTTDVAEKINYKKAEKIARLIFHTAWKLANRKHRPKLDVPIPENLPENN